MEAVSITEIHDQFFEIADKIAPYLPQDLCDSLNQIKRTALHIERNLEFLDETAKEAYISSLTDAIQEMKGRWLRYAPPTLHLL